MPKIIQWIQHDPNLAEELRTNIPSNWQNTAKYLWVRSNTQGFMPCKLLNDLGSDLLQLTTQKNESLTLKKAKYDKPGMTFPLLDVDLLGLAFDDLVNLDELNEATILIPRSWPPGPRSKPRAKNKKKTKPGNKNNATKK